MQIQSTEKALAELKVKLHLAKSQKQEIRINLIVFCYDASGNPDIYEVSVTCSREEFQNKLHYEMAKNIAICSGYNKPMVACDEDDELYYKVIKDKENY